MMQQCKVQYADIGPQRCTMARQDFEFELELPTPNKREHWESQSRRTRQQRYLTRRWLERLAVRPALPCTVTLIRISTQYADNDRSALSMAAVRDEVARWVYGIPAYEIGKDGKPRVPRAPDGPTSGITWRYGQQRTKRWREVIVKGKRKRRGYQGVRIQLQTTEEQRRP